MKIEINETTTERADFPAFYKDRYDELWFWGDAQNGVCISDGDFHCDNECVDVDFYSYSSDYEFVRVHGTITITV